MKNATLRQLKVFETVARHLSFSRAAEELHLTQPAVSTQVRQLELHVGLPLFEQLGKRIYLTPAGTEMLHYSRCIIQQFREAEDAMAQLKGISGGRLNVAVISAGDYFFPRLLAEFMNRHESVTLNLAVHNREELLHQLAGNLTDLAVMVRPPEGMDTIAEAFAPHPYVIVAAPNHPLVDQRNIPLADLAEEAFVSREKGSDTWNSMQEGFAGRLSNLRIAMEIKSTETIKQAVIANMGIAFLSAHTVGLELQAGKLAVLDIQGFPVMLNWYVVHRKNKRLPPVALAFKHFLMEEGATLIQQITGVEGLIRPRAIHK
ncbi:LysR family transcriptional regulator, low CO2-responsive transcriptional regulator [Cupriavidus metallidurans]|jgi:DNA-binding transcriptional LysR family regulator|uniref:LysR-type transcriptional regulator n=1 Tax=Cupriavidus metallidurans (strain ATCC 43123 / DSM 2839 / NBRC 102507 / CH34) TaxID=266264 RepID=Q1LF46_CUPMC|nr:LysR family transcriptional regulator [Cupriavidus metallidurans]ABF11230.1 LysR-type transcriptional regulator [Cupriavidus metallidurans CH34]KWW39278.1 HTH-type transcriptional activator CmpR [Cupriavidus metallidurans]MDE4920498.1 LysR family transcriptional regulator [Cupriavidus metallidurans]QGS33159.1 LysR family transcriptional regulator [Cupriavidus metallidurans]